MAELSDEYLDHVYDYVYIDDATGVVKEQGRHCLRDLIGDRPVRLAKHASDCPCGDCRHKRGTRG